jgi:dTDP-4-dehydrorhamnose 3,5-epimerase
MSGAIAAAGGIELVFPECEKGIGSLIQAPDSPHLIAGVRVVPHQVWPDDRGYFLEILRFGQGLVSGFSAAETQVSAAFGYPGAIKAFHYHLRQTDVWTPLQGMFQVALADLRRGSSTFGARNTLYAGALRPWQILIPPGVAHGYKIIGTAPAMLVYATDRFYDPADEGRLPFDHPSIHYDWETQHK